MIVGWDTIVLAALWIVWAIVAEVRSAAHAKELRIHGGLTRGQGRFNKNTHNRLLHLEAWRAGLDKDTFEDCFARGRSTQEIARNIYQAKKAHEEDHDRPTDDPPADSDED